MPRVLLAFAVICAAATPAFAEETAPAPQVVIFPGEVVPPAGLPQSAVTEEAAISAPEAATSKSGCRGRGSTVYLTN